VELGGAAVDVVERHQPRAVAEETRRPVRREALIRFRDQRAAEIPERHHAHPQEGGQGQDRKKIPRIFRANIHACIDYAVLFLFINHELRHVYM
jgi:hypothetical protein